MNPFDLNPDAAGSILDTLHQINAVRGRGKVTSYSRVRGELTGTAVRRIQVTHYDSTAYRPFGFRLFQGRDGAWRIRALGLVRKLEVTQ